MQWLHESLKKALIEVVIRKALIEPTPIVFEKIKNKRTIKKKKKKS